MAILDAVNDLDERHLFLGISKYTGQEFYRHGGDVFKLDHGRMYWYCTWAAWLSIGHKVVGVSLKEQEEAR